MSGANETFYTIQEKKCYWSRMHFYTTCFKTIFCTKHCPKNKRSINVDHQISHLAHKTSTKQDHFITWMVRVPSSLTNIWPCVVPANIKSCDPSFVQKTEGGGLPIAWHSKVAIPFIPTRWSLGFTTKLGCAVNKISVSERRSIFQGRSVLKDERRIDRQQLDT